MLALLCFARGQVRGEGGGDEMDTAGPALSAGLALSAGSALKLQPVNQIALLHAEHAPQATQQVLFPPKHWLHTHTPKNKPQF